MSNDTSSEHNWNSTFKQFRIRTGLSQSDFLNAYSVLWMDLDPESTEYKQLEEIGVDNLTNLDNSVISKYESVNIPKRRNRHISLIWGLSKLNVIQTVDEANSWLFEASQGALTPKEQLAIFGSMPAPIDKAAEQVTKPVESTNAQKNEGTNEEQPTVFQDRPIIDGLAGDPLATSTIAQHTHDIAQTIAAEPSAKSGNQSPPIPPSRTEQTLYSWIISNTAKIIQWSLMGIGIAVLLVVATTGLSIAGRGSETTTSNLVLNGDFSNGLDGWRKQEENDAGKLEIYIGDEALCADIIDSGTDLTFVTLEYFRLPELSANTEYSLSFDVDVSAPRTIGIQVRPSVYRTQKLMGGSQSINMAFFQDIDNSSATLRFRLGGHGSGEICFDNIVIAKNRLISFPEKDAFRSDPNNLLPNGGFDKGMQGWWISSGDDSELSLSVRNGELCSEIFTEGDHYFANRFGHGRIFSQYTEDPSQNKHYILSFDVTKSNTEGEIQFGFTGADNVLKKMVVQPGPQRIEGVELKYQESPDSANLMFLVGLLEKHSVVCLDNIELIPVKDSIQS